MIIFIIMTIIIQYYRSHLDCFEKVAKQMKSTPLPAIVNTRMSNQKPATQKDVKLNN